MWFQDFTWRPRNNAVRIKVAEDNDTIFENASYDVDKTVQLKDSLEAARTGQKVYLHGHKFDILGAVGGKAGVIELTKETSLGAAYRLVTVDGITSTVTLNFANPKYPGGGYRSGSFCQEEDICRGSLLYYFIVTCDTMYDVNYRNLVGTDNMIMTPSVPIIRDDECTLLPEPVLQGFITCAAPRANNYTGSMEELNSALEQRIRNIILCAIQHGYDGIVLGAFGCGAFGCDINAVTVMFKKILVDEGLRHYFTKVTFAVHSETDRLPDAFRKAFGDLIQ